MVTLPSTPPAPMRTTQHLQRYPYDCFVSIIYFAGVLAIAVHDALHDFGQLSRFLKERLLRSSLLFIITIFRIHSEESSTFASWCGSTGLVLASCYLIRIDYQLHLGTITLI